MKIKIIALVLLSFSALGQSWQVKKYLFNKQVVIFKERGDILISHHCFKTSSVPKCLAFSELSKISRVSIPANQLRGGIPSGVAICRYQLKGKVLISVDKNRNENGFCELADSSMIDLGSLTHQGLLNDKLKAKMK
ncbi:hypothetical protein A9Q84_03145 [Halobacteriovorax marinus]|uniref:Uncharacterized protein n=1 Tax=Halobacteriovorax marinus TaxID=97084 RepID=A0A1Y5FIN2_9BACT|nr:hypothetical protein A9Q84_03145 [Halobacteriovorax marinus]